MTVPVNILQQVATYQMSMLALLTNQNCFIGSANKEFQNFQDFEGNLGSTVTFDLPPRFVSNPTLTAVMQTAEQRVHSLTVDQAENVSYAFTDQQFLFNVEDYMERFGKSAIATLGTKVESNVALNCLSPYLFYGNGQVAINSYGQLAKAVAYFRNIGSTEPMKGYLDDIAVADIINNGLNQFVPGRNEVIANSWLLGDFARTTWMQSNLLPTHISGNTGQDQDVLTLVSINAAGTSLVFSGATRSGGNDPDAVKENDLFSFTTDVRYLTRIGNRPTQNKVQFRATADAASVGGNVTITVDPPLISAFGINQNLSRALTTSDTAIGNVSHRRGMLVCGNALYCAIPRLPSKRPYDSVSKTDPKTGVSLRSTYGATLTENQQGFVNDIIWGSTMVPEYGMALLFPLG